MIHRILIQEGYLVLTGFIVMHIIFLRNRWVKSKVVFSPFKKWTWDKPPKNYISIFYVDVIFGSLFLFMALVLINVLGYAIMCGYLSLTCWIIAARLFFRVRKLEYGQTN